MPAGPPSSAERVGMINSAGTVVEQQESEKHSGLGTKWLMFWNYFSLPVGGIVGLLAALSMPDMSIILVPLSILQFVVAYGLHHRRMWAWKWNWVLIAISLFSASIPPPATGSHDGGAEVAALFLVKFAIFSLVFLWPNIIYWKKRKVLFV